MILKSASQVVQTVHMHVNVVQHHDQKSQLIHSHITILKECQNCIIKYQSVLHYFTNKCIYITEIKLLQQIQQNCY